MSLNRTRARQLLADGDLRSLFIDGLGWDHHTTSLDITIDGSILTLSALAQKRGMVAYRYTTPSAQPLPDYAQRRKIEHQVAKAAHEHLIVFTDAANQTQIWQWLKREPGKPAACREHTFHRSQPGDALVQKLEAIAFTLEEEERLSLTDVTRRTRAGFDVERVTKRFYDRFQKEHTAFLKFITGITDRADHEWYASVMLNRLMFVYFIQRKGFLDGDRDYLRNRLNRMRTKHGRDKFYSFYRYFLLRLFHEGLGGRKRTPDLEKLVGHIPYLDGGIFDVHELERPDRYGKTIQIPDDAFEHIFDYFDQYQWHLDERPLRADNEINPDVLGYIFEKYINQKQMGAYYTKEDITEYISKNTMIPFLFDAARAKCKVAFENPKGPTVWDLLKDDPDPYIYKSVRHGVTWKYIPGDTNQGEPLAHPLELPPDIAAGLNPPTLHQLVDEGPIQTLKLRKGWNRPAPSEYALPTETWREVVARRKRYEEVRAKLAAGEVRHINDLVTLNLDVRQFAQDAIANCEGPDLLRAFWHAIEKVTVLDPTCGSGAFLFAALNILEPLYQACLDRMEAFLEDLERYGKKHRPEKFSDFRKVLTHMAAHPNRRYFILKTIILTNLYGVDIMEEAVEICKLRLFLKLAAQVDPDTAAKNLGVEPLPDIDFNIRAGNTLVGFTSISQVRDAAENEQERDESGQRQSRFLLGDANARISKIEQTATELQQTFDVFRARQIESDGSVPTEDKQELRNRLKALDGELNRYLAGEYGVQRSKNDACAKWLNSHQPFHWFVEFYGIMSSGGFDVIIGNPPYVEYRKVRSSYTVQPVYSTLPCGNLYTLVLERSYSLARRNGWVSLIMPLSLVCTTRTEGVRELIREHPCWISCYDMRPSSLFEGVAQRLAILVSRNSAVDGGAVAVGGYRRWMAEERSHLISSMCYTPVPWHRGSASLSKLSLPLEQEVLPKIGGPSLEQVCSDISGAIYVHRIVRYFVKALNFLPLFKDAQGRIGKSEDYKEFRFDPAEQDEIAALLNSTLFYWFWRAHCDGFHCGYKDVYGMPYKIVTDAKYRQSLKRLLGKLIRHLNETSTVKSVTTHSGNITYQEFSPATSKPILDEIDQVLARHYGFTEEELDFIINYDIKYRIGCEAEENE